MTATRMSRFRVFIGTWSTTGEVFAVGDVPPTSVVATDTYRWVSGQHFILHEVDAPMGGTVARSIEVMGFDASRNTLTGLWELKPPKSRWQRWIDLRLERA